MVTVVIEIETPVPEINNIKKSFYEQIESQMKDLIFEQKIQLLNSLKIPELPSLPNPLFVGLDSPPEALAQMLGGIQILQDFTTIFTYLTSFSTVLLTPITLLVGKIPNIDFSIVDFMLGDVQKLFDEVTEVIQHPERELPYGIQKQPYFCFSSPVTYVEIVKDVLKEYRDDLLNQTSGIIEQVADKLQVQIPSLPTLQKFTSQDLYNEVFSLIGGNPFDILSKYSLEDLTNVLPIIVPPSLKDFYPTLFTSNTEKDFKEFIRAIVDYYSNIYFNAIVDLINTTFSTLGIKFPLLRFEISSE